MMKMLLLAGAAALAVATPAMAQSVNTSVNYSNSISTSLSNSSTYSNNTSLGGNITLSGNIELDSATTATTDDKQITDSDKVTTYPNPNPGGTPTSNTTNATYGADVSGASGNVGINVATGWYNSQSNIGTVAASTSMSPNPDDGGWGKANTTSYQSLTNTNYGASSLYFVPFFGFYSTANDTNMAMAGNINGSGNIGVNEVAGAFNQQQNLMTLASVADSSLADASAGVIQKSSFNNVQAQNSMNSADVGTISGAGNIGVNVAAGIGNQQHNSLTVSASR